MSDEEHVGPLNAVEVMLIKGEHDRHDVEIKRLDEVAANLERSIAQTRRELQSLKDRQKGMLREVLKTRGKDPGKSTMRVLQRSTDGTTWIVIGGTPMET